jgi:hypothetical protein
VNQWQWQGAVQTNLAAKPMLSFTTSFFAQVLLYVGFQYKKAYGFQSFFLCQESSSVAFLAQLAIL